MAMTSSAQKQPDLPAQAKRLRDAQERLLRDSKDGDFTVQCGIRTWKCSAMILSQRCDFFKIAISGAFKESETKIVKLNDETPEEIDMLLLHLYTLEDPDFEDKKQFKHRYPAAESALKLGDKYNLPDLGTAGQQYMLQSFKYFSNWQVMVEDDRQKWIRRLERLWTRNHTGTDPIWETAISKLVALAKDVIEYEPFQKLCEEHIDFAFEFMRAQAKIADELRASLPAKPLINTGSASGFPFPTPVIKRRRITHRRVV